MSLEGQNKEPNDHGQQENIVELRKNPALLKEIAEKARKEMEAIKSKNPHNPDVSKLKRVAEFFGEDLAKTNINLRNISEVKNYICDLLDGFVNQFNILKSKKKTDLSSEEFDQLVYLNRKIDELNYFYDFIVSQEQQDKQSNK